MYATPFNPSSAAFATLSISGLAGPILPAAAKSFFHCGQLFGMSNSAVIRIVTGPRAGSSPAADIARAALSEIRVSYSLVFAGVYTRPDRVNRGRPLPTTGPSTTNLIDLISPDLAMPATPVQDQRASSTPDESARRKRPPD